MLKCTAFAVLAELIDSTDDLLGQQLSCCGDHPVEITPQAFVYGWGTEL